MEKGLGGGCLRLRRNGFTTEPEKTTTNNQSATRADQGPSVINLSRTKVSIVATPIVTMATIAKRM